MPSAASAQVIGPSSILNRKLREVEQLPDDTAQILLGRAVNETEEADEQEDARAAG